MKEKLEIDVLQKLVDLILRSEESHETKMSMLEALEPTIEVAYASGRTNVKPVALMSADDLVS